MSKLLTETAQTILRLYGYYVDADSPSETKLGQLDEVSSLPPSEREAFIVNLFKNQVPAPIRSSLLEIATATPDELKLLNEFADTATQGGFNHPGDEHQDASKQIGTAIEELNNKIDPATSEGKVVKILSPLLPSLIISDPTHTLQALTTLVHEHLTPEDTLKHLSNVAPALTQTDTNIDNLHTLVTSALEYHNVSSQSIPKAVDQIILYKVAFPQATKDEVRKYLQDKILPQLEENKAISNPEPALAEVQAQTEKYSRDLDETETVKLTTAAEISKTGISPQSAHDITATLYKHDVLVISVGIAKFAPSSPSVNTKTSQVQAFQALFKQGLGYTAGHPQTPADLHAQINQVDRNLDKINFEKLNQALSETISQQELYDASRYTANSNLGDTGFIWDAIRNNPITDTLLSRAKEAAVSRFMETGVGKQVSSHLTKLGLKKGVETTAKTAASTGAKVATKAAATTAAKTATKEGVALAIKAGLAASLSEVPIVGTILGWLAGEVIAPLVGWLVEKLIPLLQKLKENISEVAGGAVAAGVMLAGGGPLLAAGAGGATWLGGSILTGNSQVLSAAGAKANQIISSATTMAVGAVFAPVVVCIIVIPIVTAFFLYIIDSGAYVVPPSGGFFAGSPSGSTFPPGPGGAYPSCWPTVGTITQGPPGTTTCYNCNNAGNCWVVTCSHVSYSNNAIDIANVEGTPVYATHDGVAYAQISNVGYGNLITISSPLGFQTMYAHLYQFNIPMNTNYPITAGTQIGLMGTTGNSTGEHLHYELRPNPPPTINGIVPNNPALSPPRPYRIPVTSSDVTAGCFARDVGGSASP